jgi:predicted nucleotidyltransferase
MDEEIKCLIDKVASALKKAGAQEVYLFGSATVGTISEYSDIDLAVAGLPPEKFFYAMGKAHRIIGRPLDLIDLDVTTPFTDYLKKKGKLVRVA